MELFLLLSRDAYVDWYWWLILWRVLRAEGKQSQFELLSFPLSLSLSASVLGRLVPAPERFGALDWFGPL